MGDKVRVLTLGPEERITAHIRGPSSEPSFIFPLQVDRIRLWVNYNKVPMYPIFDLLKGDYGFEASGVRGTHRLRARMG